MKKVVFKIVIALLIFINTLPVNAASTTVKAGTTLADLRNDLKKLQQEKVDSENAQKKTKNEINANKNNIANANKEIEEAKKQIILLTDEISKTNDEIIKLKDETESLLVLYQKLESENVYVSYVSGASTITDFIMRVDAINQVTEYSKQKINDLEVLITSNEKMSKELVKYQDKLNSKIVSYESSIKSLGKDLAELVENYEDIDSQIKGLKDVIKYYESAGCKEDQDLTKCISIVNNTGWTRPLTKGKITSAWGYRLHPTQKVWKFHNGIDIGGNGEGTNIYSSAAGTVAKITSKSSCGGNMVYIWVYVNGKPYTVVYMHMLNVYVKVGDKVTTDTVIGTVGGGAKTKSYDKCTTGAHLHYGVSTGLYLNGGVDGYTSYSKYIANSINPPNFPAYGSWFYSR